MTDTPTTPTISWVDKIGGRVKTHGAGTAAKMGWEEIKAGVNVFSEASKGHRALAFKRVGATTAGLAMAGDAIFRSKSADGEDRSALVRLGEGVLGAGLAVGGVVAGGR